MSIENLIKKLTKPAKFRQGDVLLTPVDELPSGLVPARETQDKSVVLQHSETSGHHHHFKLDADVTLYKTAEAPKADNPTITPDEGKYISVGPNGAILFHGKGFEEKPVHTGNGDHHSITVPPGNYKVSIINEYDYEAKMAVKVVD